MNAYSRVNDMSTTMKSDGRHNFIFLRVFTSFVSSGIAGVKCVNAFFLSVLMNLCIKRKHFKHL